MKRILACGAVALFATFAAAAQEETPPADASSTPASTDAAAAPASADASSSGSTDASSSSSGSSDSSSSASADSSSGSSDSSSSGSSDASSSSSSSSDSSSSSGGSAAAGLAGDSTTASAPVPADTKPGFPFYLGVERDQVKLEIGSNSKQEKFGRRRLDSDFYKLRAGVRIFQGVGVELDAGAGENNKGDDEGKIKDFVGAYIVPTAVAFEVLEISGRLGYSYMDVKNSQAKTSFDGVSYGIAFELPLRDFGQSLPNIRFTLCGMVYSQDHTARNYGWSGGLRYDFNM